MILTIELLEESRSRMHRLIDERYDELLGSLADGRRISENPRTMALTSSPFLFKGEKPVSLTMRDGRTIPTPTWKSVALAVLKDCNNEPEMHQRLMNLRGSVAGRTRFILSAILCCIEREKGGAWQTVQYAIKQEKDIINLYDESNI